MDALELISDIWPDKGLAESTTVSPVLVSRITELQVHTLLSVSFEDHEVWTRTEIYNHLCKIARGLNLTSVKIYPNKLSVDGAFSHTKYIHKISEEEQ